jgi:RNase P subunit RPR2
MIREYRRYLKRRGSITVELEPDRWEKISKHLVWRCCGCAKVHRVQFRVRKNGDIEIREWKDSSPARAF